MERDSEQEAGRAGTAGDGASEGESEASQAPRVIDSNRVRERPGATPPAERPAGPTDEAAEDPPEGKPAENEPNPRQISLLLIMIVLGLLVVALLFGLFVRAEIGIAVGVLAVLLVVFNPEFWALILRAKDRVDAGDRP